jgi:hypothetical protein
VIHRWGAGWYAFVTVLNEKRLSQKQGKRKEKPSHPIEIAALL